jgi:hypothetical protein
MAAGEGEGVGGAVVERKDLAKSSPKSDTVVFSF